MPQSMQRAACSRTARFRQGRDEVAKVGDPLGDRRVAVLVADDFQKTGWLTHDS
jgi:hypothetical protein